MKLIIAKDYEEMSKKAADLIAAQILMKPNCVLGLATGGSPEGTYRHLVEKYNEGTLDFFQVSSVNLDEYKGLTAEDPQSYHYYMNEHLFHLVNIRKQNTFVPDGANPDAQEACSIHEQTIASLGGIDLQLLGIGPDGHIGFNEPGDSFDVLTHCAKLEDSTIEANKRYFEKKEDVPTEAYTMGIRAIMQARKVVMVVNGSAKANIVKEALYGPVTPKIPASILQLHPDCTVILDQEAASAL